MLIKVVDRSILGQLPNQEQIKQSPRSKEKYYGEALLRYVLNEEYGNDAIMKSRKNGVFGKPFLSESNVYYSVSHSDGNLVLGVSCYPLGIDMESINEMAKMDSSIWLSEREKRDETIQNTWHYLKLWTVKEAVLKLYGTGFRVMPHHLTINDIRGDASVSYADGHDVKLKVDISSTDQILEKYIVSVASFQQWKAQIKLYFMGFS